MCLVNHKKVFTLFALLLIQACGSDVNMSSESQDVVALENDFVESKPLTSEGTKIVVPDKPGLFEGNWIGVIIPNNSVDVVANTGGLLSISAAVGDVIRQGNILARVENFGAEDDLEIEELKLQALKAELEQAGFNAEKEQALFDRRISHPDAISKDELDRSESSAREAEARWKVTQSNVEEQEIRVDQYKQAILAQSIGSPFSGTVVSHYMDSGSVVTAGTAIMRISTSNTFIVRFAINPDQVNLLSSGSKVIVKLGQVDVTAEVIGVAPFVDIPSQKVFVEAFPTEQNNLLRAGLSVEVTTDPFDGIEVVGLQ